MKLYCENKNYKLYQGDSLQMLEVIKPKSIDAIITDPPYELGFMSKKWDSSGIAFNTKLWKNCYEVLKPGGYLLAFGGTRTFHRIACAIEDAGFEIRDTIMWLYGSGFPKSLNLGKALDRKNGVDNIQHKGEWNFQHGNMEEFWKRKKEYKKEEDKPLETEIAKQWQGWGTCLKPAYEPIIVARKPFKGSLVDNVIEYGVGGINIDECRIYNNETITSHDTQKGTFAGKTQTMPSFKGKNKLSFGQYEDKAERIEYTQHEGRFPSNVILTYDDNDYDEVCGGMPYTASVASEANWEKSNCDSVVSFTTTERKSGVHFGDEGSAARYFYCAKASKKDRDEGLKSFEEISPMEQTGRKEHSLGLEYIDEKGQLHQNPYAGTKSYKKNIHPTVKPMELMQYLVRLVSPKNAIILDPFNGSGSTGKAIMYENREREANYKYIGIELTEDYLPISKARIDEAMTQELAKEIKLNDKETAKQQDIFDFIDGDKK